MNQQFEKIIIRPANQEDVETVFELGKNISGFEVSSDIITFWPKQLLTNSINQDDVIFLIMEQENKTIGFLIMNLNYSLSKGEIEDIYVIEEERQKGYGSKLLMEAINIAQTRGVKYKIEYINALTNTAEEFFQKNNFIKGNTFIWFSLPLTDIFKNR